MRFRALGLAAATMLWLNHAPALRALGASAREYYGEVWLELGRFGRRLRLRTAAAHHRSGTVSMCFARAS
jgi:hypothetical protein